MKLPFSKMHGLGNDFVILDATQQKINLTTDLVRRLSDRHFGIGCDQVLIVENPDRDGAEFRYRIFNADGEEVEQCGNGIRCFARFVHSRGLVHKSEFAVDTAGGRIYPRIEPGGDISVNMGVPDFIPEHVPFLTEHPDNDYLINVDDKALRVGVVSMGNPHVVLRVDNVDDAPVAVLGPKLENHPRFPKRANVGFMQIKGRDHIRLRVFERGVGETLACGTGACAAVAVARRNNWVDERVSVELPGGTLTISWQGPSYPIWMTGPATFVFEGTIEV